MKGNRREKTEKSNNEGKKLSQKYKEKQIKKKRTNKNCGLGSKN